MKIKLPYGISNFADIVEQNYLYIDRTKYIEILETEIADKYILFIRPRRFGKSLFVSVLDYYYNIKYKDKFEKLFGKYYIGKNPTPLKNSYLVLRFNFSGINTETKESTYNGFLDKVKVSVKSFLNMYENILKINQEDKNQILENKTPESIIDNLFELVKTKTEKKIYILIDEYDHFANELISFNLTDFYKIVTQNGFVRKFYETIKIGTKSVVDRIFITGVTPITLDSLTSGFNIKSNLSTEKMLNEMLGFTHLEVKNLIEQIISECPMLTPDEILNEMIDNYDGYLFNEEATERVFNSDMVLYYLKNFKECEKPRKLLDSNIASDYNKIKRLFNIKNYENNYKVLNDLVREDYVVGRIVDEFSLEKRFDTNDLISLLYYTGIITIKESELDGIRFQIPNYVIKELYYQYFVDILSEKSQYEIDTSKISSAIRNMAKYGDITELVKLVEELLQSLSSRDLIKFDEKYVKLIFITYIMMSDLYFVHSEEEVNYGYKDITCIGRDVYGVQNHFIFELKYIKKSEEEMLFEKKSHEAEEQLKRYRIKRNVKGQIHKFGLIFVGPECKKIIRI